MSMTDQDVLDLTITAVESGGYGSLVFSLSDHLPTVVPEGVEVSEEPVASERLGLALLAGQPLLVKDIYGDEPYTSLTREALTKAVAQLATRRGMSVDDWIAQHDVADADAAFQIAAFGEVIYG